MWEFILFWHLQILVLSGDKKVSSLTVSYEPSSVAVNQHTGDVAVGGTGDNKVYKLMFGR